MSNHYIKDAFQKYHPIVPDRKMLHSIIAQCHLYETKHQHAQALNTPLLGVYPIYFQNTDQDALFHILGVDAVELKNTIATIPTINTEHVVSSDPYNLITIWAVHCILNTHNLPNNEAQEACLSLFKLLHYKFYTSLMVKNFPHKARAEVMRAVIENLSNKYDIIHEKTWKNVMIARSKDILGPGSIHIRTLKQFDDDKNIIYVLSDAQSRLRNKIRLIVTEYYNAIGQGNALGSYGIIDEVEGEKLIGNVDNTRDTMISNLSNQALNVYTFVDNALVTEICRQFPALRPDMFRTVLTKFSEMAVMQSKSGDLDLVQAINHEDYYVGARKLLSELIQKTYRYCEHNKVNMRSKYEIVSRIRNLYASSRANDPDIVRIKQSITLFVIGCGESSRPATIASITIGFVMYIIVKSLVYL